MKFLRKLRKHAAMASGNFDAIFKGVRIPPLPAAVSSLIAEAGRKEPDLDRLVRLISAEAAIAAKMVETVNSAMFGLRTPVTDVRRAVTVLGVKKVRSLALALATMTTVPRPKGSFFDHQAFWQDSLLRASLARALCRLTMPDLAEEAFTAALLADIALPVLLVSWSEYYLPVVEQWRLSPMRLSQIERRHFGWDHGQAGAWIVRSWGLPDEMVFYIGAHNLELEKISLAELEHSIVVPLAVACLAGSVLKPDEDRLRLCASLATTELGIDPRKLILLLKAIRTSLFTITEAFGIQENDFETILDLLAGKLEARIQEEREAK